MAKGIGLIGNFKGKVGNMVGYKLSDSNTGNSQGIRVYQPIVKNPKTSAQAEQRAKLAPINATYRALKMVIDRGNEGLPYGNKSRLAWLKQAFKAETMPWFVKGALISDPVVCQLTKGSLAGLDYEVDDSSVLITANNVTSETDVTTIGKVSTVLKAQYPSLKEGDQITFVYTTQGSGALQAQVASIIIKSDDTTPTTMFAAQTSKIGVLFDMTGGFGAAIVSREGDNGQHLRSTALLKMWTDIVNKGAFAPEAKAAAIESYQNAAGANSDWAEESIQ